MLLPPPHMHLQGRQPRRSLWLPVGTKHLSGGRQSTGSHAKEEGRVATGHGSTQPAEQKPPGQHKARGKDAHEAGTHLGNREGAANAASTAQKPRELPALPEAWKGKNTTVKAERQHQVSEGKVRGMAWARRQGRQSKARQRMESKGATESKANKHTLNRKGMLAARNKITQRKQQERQRIHK